MGIRWYRIICHGWDCDLLATEQGVRSKLKGCYTGGNVSLGAEEPTMKDSTHKPTEPLPRKLKVIAAVIGIILGLLLSIIIALTLGV